MRRRVLAFVLVGGLLHLISAPAAQAQGAANPPAQPAGFVRQFGTDELRGDSHLFDLDISPDGRVAAVAGITLRFWNLTDRKLIGELDHPEAGSFQRVRFSPDGRRLGGLTAGGEVVVWDLENRAPVLRLPAPETRYRSLTFSRDGK